MVAKFVPSTVGDGSTVLAADTVTADLSLAATEASVTAAMILEEKTRIQMMQNLFGERSEDKVNSEQELAANPLDFQSVEEVMHNEFGYKMSASETIVQFQHENKELKKRKRIAYLETTVHLQHENNELKKRIAYLETTVHLQHENNELEKKIAYLEACSEADKEKLKERIENLIENFLNVNFWNLVREWREENEPAGSNADKE